MGSVVSCLRTLSFASLLVVWLPLTAQASVPEKAAIASAHPLATTAGMAMLEAGGNAFDAAVAVATTLAVVEPYGSGLGGGGFFLLHDTRTGKEVVIDARETAPSRATHDMYQNNRREVMRDLAINGPLAAGIPGLPAGIVHLAAGYGTLPLATSLKPAIQLARDGFPADERFRQMARVRLEVLRQQPEASNAFLLKGEVPPLGTLIKQPDLARTLEKLASEGHDGFYAGPFAQTMVEAIEEAGGIWTVEDLARYRVKERAPLIGSYRGARIVTMPPPSAGGVALLAMLNMLDSAGYATASANVRDHMIIEVMRRAFRDRAQYLGDPDFVSVPVASLVSPEHAKALMKSFDRTRMTASASLGAQALPPPQGDNTTHFSILDRNSNRVAATLSINLPFGAGFIVPGTGVLLNNEMDDFTAAPGAANEYGLFSSDANAIAPGKRPLSSMTPTFIEFNDRVAILGTPGGSRIPGMVLISTLALLEAAEPSLAVSLPRMHHQYLPDVVEVEPEYFGSDRARQLRARGHTLKSTGRSYGNSQIVLWEKDSGRVSAASDPRGVGSAQTK